MKTSSAMALMAACVLFAACEERKEAPAVRRPPPPVVETHPTPAKPRFDPEVVRRGEMLYAQAVGKNPESKLEVWGSGFPTVKACLWIPEDDWDSLLPEDREALITWLKAQVPAIRRSPDRYTGILSTAPVYGRIRGNIANMQDDAFIVFTMVPKDGQWIQSRTVAESQ